MLKVNPIERSIELSQFKAPTVKSTISRTFSTNCVANHGLSLFLGSKDPLQTGDIGQWTVDKGHGTRDRGHGTRDGIIYKG